MSFGNFGSKPMKTPKAPKAPGKKPFSSRTVIGVICIVLALLITFGVAPLVNRFTDQKVDIVRLKADVPRGQIITADHLEIVNVGSYNLPNNVIKDGNIRMSEDFRKRFGIKPRFNTACGKGVTERVKGITLKSVPLEESLIPHI